MNLGGSSVLTINPGVYSQISVSGDAQLTMNPGIYEIAGGGFSVSDSGSVTGSGVLIYNAGSKYPSAGGTFGAVNLSGAASVQLAPPTTGPYAGIVLFQSRDNTATISMSGSAVAKFTGTFYAPAALVAVTGGAEFEPDALLVNEVQFSGSGSMMSPNVIVGSSSVPQGPLAARRHWASLDLLGTRGHLAHERQRVFLTHPISPGCGRRGSPRHGFGRRLVLDGAAGPGRRQHR